MEEQKYGQIKLTMLDLTYIIPDMKTKTNTDNRTEERRNRFTGQSIMLTKEEANKHDAIFINELQATIEDKERNDTGISKFWEFVRRDLDWFRKHNPKAYMVLLD